MSQIDLIKSLMTRADALCNELAVEYNDCLSKQEVSAEARNITHEIFEKCSNALDQLMTLAWETRIKPHLPVTPRPRGYFPFAKDEADFRSRMGKWYAADIDSIDSAFATTLRACQPMTSPDNEWLSTMRDLANKKHTTLVPQTKIVDRREVNVTSDNRGSVTWNPDTVTFGHGVSVCGASVDPGTQMSVETEGVKTEMRIWARFLLENSDIEALPFCKKCIQGTNDIIKSFESALSLP